ncbi:two-component system chemotaxis response regulator CheV [Aeromonas salmonicida subsp. salmonicida 01-B526]|uniref:Two-component system chemotaxis response regulator CheV n=1 Tax=Aeromonas salmonicida subsp. salmonicida 01-B526 TaxID=1076135 RepID=A0ABN0DY51_AERSS|nr:two-component system chemotaxis response regulator CheV [Aeromonas salmonicida subsp. salmonicida 01-B526]
MDQRTQLVGENRLELLMFRLGSRQLFAINVFKVREVVKLPHLNKMPGAHHNISGVANIRGTSIPVINLRSAIGMRAMPIDSESNLIITEYNRTIQGFLVGQVAHIVNMTWKDILPPPALRRAGELSDGHYPGTRRWRRPDCRDHRRGEGAGRDHYLRHPHLGRGAGPGHIAADEWSQGAHRR